MVVAVQFARFTTQKLQWQSFADTSEIHLFPDGQYMAATGRDELLKNSWFARSPGAPPRPLPSLAFLMPPAAVVLESRNY